MLDNIYALRQHVRVVILYDVMYGRSDNVLEHGAVGRIEELEPRSELDTPAMAYAFRQGDLPKLDLQVDRRTDFKARKTQWEAYLSLSGLDSQTAATHVEALTLCFSREMVTIVANLGLTAAQSASAAEIVAAIQRYVEAISTSQ